MLGRLSFVRRIVNLHCVDLITVREGFIMLSMRAYLFSNHDHKRDVMVEVFTCPSIT